MLFATFIPFARVVVKHLEVVTFHGSTIQSNILGLNFSSVVIHCSLNTQMAKMSGIKVRLLEYLVFNTDYR